MPKIVSIIPARGGSKGVPRKNLVDINGKPLIYYVIRASLGSKVDETWVSSEDDDILRVSKEFGANILRRPQELTSDTASSESALLHFAEHIHFNILVFLQATSPLTTSEDINKGIDMLQDYDSVISVCKLTQFVWINGRPNYDINNRKRRQDSEPSFLETGAFFTTTKENLYKYKNRVGGRIGFRIVPRMRSFDIDSYEDLEIVRKLMR